MPHQYFLPSVSWGHPLHYVVVGLPRSIFISPLPSDNVAVDFSCLQNAMGGRWEVGAVAFVLRVGVCWDYKLERVQQISWNGLPYFLVKQEFLTNTMTALWVAEYSVIHLGIYFISKKIASKTNNKFFTLRRIVYINRKCQDIYALPILNF